MSKTKRILCKGNHQKVEFLYDVPYYDANINFVLLPVPSPSNL